MGGLFVRCTGHVIQYLRLSSQEFTLTDKLENVFCGFVRNTKWMFRLQQKQQRVRENIFLPPDNIFTLAVLIFAAIFNIHLIHESATTTAFTEGPYLLFSQASSQNKRCVNKPQLMATLVFLGIPLNVSSPHPPQPPFQSFVQNYFLFFVLYVASSHILFSQHLLCQRDRTSCWLQHWSSRSCNIFPDN